MRSEEKLQQAMAASSPLNEPLMSAVAVVTIDFEPAPGREYKPGPHIGSGAVAGFVRRTEIFEPKTEFPLIAFTTTGYVSAPEAGIVRYRFTCDQIQDGSDFMNKPLARISRATSLQVELSKKTINTDRISGGEIVWTLNNRVALRFTLPPQAIEVIGDLHVLKVGDFKEGMAPLATEENK